MPVDHGWGGGGRSLELARQILADPLRLTGGLRTARRTALVVAQNADDAQFRNRGIKSTTRPNVFLQTRIAMSSSHHRGTTDSNIVARLRRPACRLEGRPPCPHSHGGARRRRVGTALLGTGPEEKRLGSGIRDLATRGQSPSPRTTFTPGDPRRPPPCGRSALPQYARLCPVGGWRGPLGWLSRGLPPDSRRSRTRPTGWRRGGRPHGCPPAPVAEALAATATSPRVPVQWSATELSALLPEWYERACRCPSVMTHSVGINRPPRVPLIASCCHCHRCPPEPRL